MLRSTLQIATLAKDIDPVLVGIRALPVHKLYLMYLERDWQLAQELKRDLETVLRLKVEEYTLAQSGLFDNVLQGIAEIIREEEGHFDDALVNVSSGDRVLDYAGLVSAFASGLKTFTVVNGEPFLLPLLKFSYDRILSQTKLDILRALRGNGGEVKSLAELQELTGFGKPLLSYHLRGADDSRGLVRLGLVEVDTGHRGKSMIKTTTLGWLLAMGELQAAEPSGRARHSEPHEFVEP